MANVGTSAVRIIDNDGDVVSVTSNKLDVNVHPAASVATVSLDTIAMIDVDNAVEDLEDAYGALTDCTEMILQADEDNSGYIMVGDSDVADNRGIKLNPGDTLTLTVNSTASVFVWGSAANQNLRTLLIRV